MDSTVPQTNPIIGVYASTHTLCVKRGGRTEPLLSLLIHPSIHYSPLIVLDHPSRHGSFD
jgi:hypothetical protein